MSENYLPPPPGAVVDSLLGSGLTRPDPAMLLLLPGTTVRPVEPGTLGLVAAEEP
jgi:hypothetical protein